MARRSYLVGVVGGSGSGKTSLVRALCAGLPAGSISVVSQDDYYRPRAEQWTDVNGRVNFDLPGAVDLDALVLDLHCLVSGEPIRRTEYTFNQEDKAGRSFEIHPAPVVLVEGLFILCHPPLRALFDLLVFVEASEEAQLQRRLKRDAVERGYDEEDVRYRWEHHVLPAYRTHLLPYRNLCHLHLMNETGFAAAARELQGRVRSAAFGANAGIMAEAQAS